MRPYIGITDFTSVHQVDGMKAYFADHPDTSRILHVGVMTSYKQIHGLPSKWQAVFLPPDAIADVFMRDDVYNCLHYADYDKHPGFRETLAKVIVCGGPHLHSVQLDMIWPNPDAIRSAIEDAGKPIEVVLQIGKLSMQVCKDRPQEVVERLRMYRGCVTRILLDKSMGRGHALDAKGLLPYAQAIREAFPEIGLVVAGGLGPSTLYLLDALVKDFSDISIDAQSRLRPSGNALDPIDWDMAGLYLSRALSLFGG